VERRQASSIGAPAPLQPEPFAGRSCRAGPTIQRAGHPVTARERRNQWRAHPLLREPLTLASSRDLSPVAEPAPPLQPSCARAADEPPEPHGRLGAGLNPSPCPQSRPRRGP
jgi:hypothetical protein